MIMNDELKWKEMTALTYPGIGIFSEDSDSRELYVSEDISEISFSRGGEHEDDSLLGYCAV
jgi:hypothetical protein